MSTIIQEPDLTTGTAPLLLSLKPVLNFSEDEFFDFCQINRDLRIERSAQGELIIMAPSGGDSSSRNARLNYQLFSWALRNGTGTVYDSSGGFELPDGATRSPDASWVSNARLKKLSAAQREKFLPLCPEFVIELRSPSDRVSDLQAKMQEYIDNGAQLGLLIVPEQKRVYVYRPNHTPEVLDNCETVACDPVLPGFELVVKEIW